MWVPLKYSLQVSVILLLSEELFGSQREAGVSLRLVLYLELENIFSSIMYRMMLKTHEVKFGSLICVFSLLAVHHSFLNGGVIWCNMVNVYLVVDNVIIFHLMYSSYVTIDFVLKEYGT